MERSSQMRYYHGLLKFLNQKIAPYMPMSDFRQYIKFCNPTYPRKENIPISMKHLSDDELSDHISFIKRLCDIFAIPTSDSPPVNDKFKMAIRYDCEVVAINEKTDDYVMVEIVCPSCGMATERRLTNKRYSQYSSIVMDLDGSATDEDKLSFACLYCLTEELSDAEKQQENGAMYT
jgi:hypothetical protein